MLGGVRLFSTLVRRKRFDAIECSCKTDVGCLRNFSSKAATIGGTLGSGRAPFDVGKFATLTRTFGKSDVEGFAKVSGDYNPIHFDEDFAKQTRFGRPIVHGMLVSSLFSTLIATQIPGAIYISQSLSFKAPVYIGDEITAQITVEESSAVKLVCKTTVTSASGLHTPNGSSTNVCIHGDAIVMLPRQSKP